MGWFWPEIEDRPLRFGSGRGDSLFFLDACECEAGSWGFLGGLQGSPIKPVAAQFRMGTLAPVSVAHRRRTLCFRTRTCPADLLLARLAPSRPSLSSWTSGLGKPAEQSVSPRASCSCKHFAASLLWYLAGLTGHAHCWPRHGPDLEPEHPLSAESHLPSLFSQPLAPISSTRVFQLTSHWENSPSQR